MCEDALVGRHIQSERHLFTPIYTVLQIRHNLIIRPIDSILIQSISSYAYSSISYLYYSLDLYSTKNLRKKDGV